MNALSVHPRCPAPKAPEPDCRALVPAEGPPAVDTFGGRVHVKWDPSAAVTAQGQLPFSILLSILCGQWRNAQTPVNIVMTK